MLQSPGEGGSLLGGEGNFSGGGGLGSWRTLWKLVESSGDIQLLRYHKMTKL